MISLRIASLLAACVLLSPREVHAFEHHHALGSGYHWGNISSETAGGFHLRSVPVTYLGRYGGTWAAALRMGPLFPLRARQGDLKFSPRAEYEQTEQWDAFLGASRRFSDLGGFLLDAALGAHMNYVRFRSNTYVEWSSAAAGLGLGASARRRLTTGLWGSQVEWGGSFDLSYDFIDLSRGGDLQGAVQSQSLLFVGVAWGAP